MWNQARWTLQTWSWTLFWGLFLAFFEIFFIYTFTNSLYIGSRIALSSCRFSAVFFPRKISQGLFDTLFKKKQFCKLLVMQLYPLGGVRRAILYYRLFFLRSCAIFYKKILELFCQFISWTNWVNFGKFMDKCWISCQLMVDMKIFYNDLIEW